ncbi:MAG TPA: response regulator [Thermoanaerobaculia bacterium]
MDRSILIVDDEPAVVDALRAVLSSYDVTVESTNNAADATALLDQKRYCGLVLDLVLENSSGFDVLHHIAKHKLFVATVVVTGKLPSYVREMLDEDHVKLVLPKPVEARLLAAVVLGLCGIPV